MCRPSDICIRCVPAITGSTCMQVGGEGVDGWVGVWLMLRVFSCIVEWGWGDCML